MSARSVALSGRKPTVISTFAGCGGSSLGYQMAGFQELLAVEWDNNAIATFRANFPDVPVYHGDIAKLSSKECMKLAGIKRGQLDILDGSPPCQGFSTAGKRKYDDPRNSLFMEFARLVKDLQPKVFVMENVTGLVKGCMKQAYLIITKTFRAYGYKVKGEVLNAAYFNVPQQRCRVFIIGIRKDLGLESNHPKPQTKPMTVREAFVGVPAEFVPAATGKVIAAYIPNVPKGGSMATLAGYGQDNLIRPRWDRPSSVIRKDAALTGYGCFIHPDENRFLSIAEYKRLQAFPDSFVMTGTYIEKKNRIGNSVPPNLMKAIAEHIKVNFLKAKKLTKSA